MFDHTSVCFLERRFGVVEENISPLAACRLRRPDFAFDFQGAGDTQVAPDLTNIPQSDARKEDAYWQQFPPAQSQILVLSPRACPARKRASALPSRCPYQLHATLALDIAAGKLRLTLGNDGMSLPGNPQDTPLRYSRCSRGKSAIRASIP